MVNDVVAKVERVSHRYGKTLALDNVTLDIPTGQMIGMIGPDGAGKSTLLGLIAGVRIIQEGRVIVFGGNMADQREGIGSSRSHVSVAHHRRRRSFGILRRRNRAVPH